MSLEELKDRIKELPVSSILSHYVSIHKKGRYHLAKCPFHNDTDPSLTINDEKGLFMCFPCQIGGDAITFVEKLKRLEFIDALKDISKAVGIPYEQYFQQKSIDPKIKMARKVLKKAATIYQLMYQEKTQKHFVDFTKSRNLNDTILKQFELGYAPNTSPIYKYLSSIKDKSEREFAINTAVGIHLIRKDFKNNNGYFDTFRNRIMFPIKDSFENIVGFGGRACEDFQKAKYLNSQESHVFNKQNILYGMHLAKSQIRQKDSVILVEGYMDLIALHKNDFSNSVAIMGVALSDYAIKTLKNYTKHFFLALDSDTAGFKAMERINQKCLESQLIPKYLNFSPYKDPDEFIEKLGKEDFFKLLDNAPSFLDTQLENLIPDPLPDSSDKKLEILQEAIKLLSPLKMALQAQERVISFAKKLQLSSDSTQIIKQYEQFLTEKSRKNSFVSNQNKQLKKNKIPANKIIPTSSSKNSKVLEGQTTKIEKRLLQELVQNPNLLLSPELLDLLDFLDNSGVKKYVARLRKIIDEVDEKEFPSIAFALIEKEGYSFDIKESVGFGLARFQNKKLEPDLLKKLLNDIKVELQKEKLKKERDSIKNLIKDCNEKNKSDELFRTLSKVEKNIHTLTNPKNLKK